MDRFDLSNRPGTSQRLVFALFGIGQLVLSSVAFQRGGFFYGLIVLICGITTFCSAVIFVHRLNRCLVFLGPEGLAIEEGWHERRALAWEDVTTVRLDPTLTVIHATSGVDIALHDLAEHSEFITRLHTITTERQIPVEGKI